MEAGCSRIINGLEVYCSNQRCQWKGDLRDIPIHLNKGKRDGECQYEEVKCRYEECQERNERRYLDYHELGECPYRPFRCQYCWKDGTYLSITMGHYNDCADYPIHCPNNCTLNTMPRHVLSAHISHQCPLEPVHCVFSWAGCNDKPLRKDVHVHTADTKHVTLLDAACGRLEKEKKQIKKENSKIKEEVQKLKVENQKMELEMTRQVQTLKEENSQLKYHLHQTTPGDLYPLLPIHIRYGSEPGRVTYDLAQLEAPTHFYTGSCGRHMSAKIVRGAQTNDAFYMVDLHVLLAFHEGKFDRLQINLKLPKIFADFYGIATPLIEDTEATYVQLPTDILNRVNIFCTAVPHGVINIKIGRMGSNYVYSDPVVIYTQ